MSKYLKELPKEKCAHTSEAGQQYRNQQLQQQLPAHDFDPSFCNELSNEEKDRMSKFTDIRDDDAGQGAIKENTPKEVTQWVCCLLYTSPSPRDKRQSRMPSSA